MHPSNMYPFLSTNNFATNKLILFCPISHFGFGLSFQFIFISTTGAKAKRREGKLMKVRQEEDELGKSLPQIHFLSMCV